MEPSDEDLGHLLDNSTAPATASVLHAIVARARLRRERRLKIVTATSIVIAIAGGTFAGLSRTTNRTPVASNSLFAKSASGIVATPSASSAWTKKLQPLGVAPKGLRWTKSASTGNSSTKETIPSGVPNASVGGGALCSVDGCPVPMPTVGSLRRLFVRTAGDVTVRAFNETLEFDRSPPTAPGTSPVPAGSVPTRLCIPSESLVVEVSNPGAIGQLTVAFPNPSPASAQPFELIDSSVVGVAESAPIEVIAVHVQSGVASVEANFADGTSDQMSPIDSWVVLVDDASAPLPASLNAMDSTGATFGSTSVTNDDAIAEPDQCIPPLMAQSGTGGASGATTEPTG